MRLKDWFVIAKRTYAVALNNGYFGISENETPSQTYINSNFDVCKKQLALAGYRLADQLNSIL